MASLSHRFAVGALFAAVAAAAFPVAVTAEPSPPAVSYEVASGCPSVAWFEQQLELQLQGRARPFGEVDVRATHGESFIGVVDYSPPADGAPFRRELEGDDCEEVLSGLALGLALHWDTLPEPPPLAPTTTAAPTTTEVQAASTTADDEFLLVPELVDPEKAPAWPWSVTAGPGWRSGTGPTLDSFGALGVERFGTGEGFSSGAYGVRLETTITSRNQGVVSADGAALSWRSRWFLVGARGCPFGKRAWRELATSLCATLSVGNYRAHIDGNAEVQATIGRLGFGPRVSLQLGHFHGLFVGAWEIPLLPVQVAFAEQPVYHQQAGFLLVLEAGVTTEVLE